MENIETEIINTPEQISDLVDWLIFRHEPSVPYPPTMYIDLEGVNLCREGSIYILTLLIDTGVPTRRVCLIDVHKLGSQAFNTAGAKRATLKDILQDKKIPKVFFDVRKDSDALFAHFSVALQGVEDVQLMESATRKTTASRKFLSSLTECVENNLLNRSGLANWNLAREKGERLYRVELGGSYDTFKQRPIPDDILSYCVGGVQCLPELRERFWGQQFRWQGLVREESKRRVAMSQRTDYQPHSPAKAMAPWSEVQNALLDQWNYVPPRYLNEFSDSYGFWNEDCDDDRDDNSDDGPTSCKYTIDVCDYELYCSD